jgi:hypothetical protein
MGINEVSPLAIEKFITKNINKKIDSKFIVYPPLKLLIKSSSLKTTGVNNFKLLLVSLSIYCFF